MTKPSIPGNSFPVLLRSFSFTASLVLMLLVLPGAPMCKGAAAAPAKPAASTKKPATTAKKPAAGKSTATRTPAKKTTTVKKATTAKTTAARKASTAKKTTTTARRARSSKRRVTTRSARFRGQRAPTTERYREIQQALHSAGFLESEPTGKWDEASTGAMKRFQQQHDLPSTGKINALSLIALGLGPKRGPAPGATSVLEAAPAAIATESNERE